MKTKLKGIAVIILSLFIGIIAVNAEQLNEPISDQEVIQMIGEDNGTIEWWYNFWELTADYPDNISYIRVHEDTGLYEIGLLENTVERQEEVLERFDFTENVVFEDAHYSHNQLREVLQEINQQMDSGVHSSIQETAIGTDYLLVIVEEGRGYSYQQEFQESYGDMIMVEEEASTSNESDDSGFFDFLFRREQGDSAVSHEVGDWAYEDADGAYEEANESENEDFSATPPMESPDTQLPGQPVLDIPEYEAYEAITYYDDSLTNSIYFPLIVMLLVVVVAGGGFLLYRNQRAQVQTADGKQAEVSVYTQEEVETKIKESSFEPSDSVYQSILEQLDQSK